MTEATGVRGNIIVKWAQEDVETCYNLLNKKSSFSKQGSGMAMTQYTGETLRDHFP